MTAAPTFAQFFHSIWGVAPFAWQVALADQVLRDGRWPEVIDLPTGAGKTSALDIAVYALACRPDIMPRRIAFVVDRRTIVDQTADRAARLARALQDTLGAQPASPATHIAQSLSGISGTGVPLDAARLRGGLIGTTDAADWLRWPDQPAVIVSTVDQFGSRLLFRGYGVSARMRPIHAGLTGHDTLVLLDEVQLSTALVETLHAVRDADPGPVGRPNQIVQMSATPVGASGERFPADPGLVTGDPVLAPRIAVVKRCRVVPPIGKPRQKPEEAWASAVGGLIAQTGIERGTIGVVVNRVATAVAIQAAVEQLGHETALVTGRMRAFERAVEQARAAAWADPEREPGDGVRVVVATQCIEVGADYSFDALITEACPLASLRQRLGRLDRRGRHAAEGEPAPALIVSTTTQPDDDPIYGPALAATLSALTQRFGLETFDGGPLSADLMGLAADAARLDPPPIQARVLMPAHRRLLAETRPEPASSPDVDAFLHGFREPNADVTLVWRFDLGGISAAGERVLCGPDAAQTILEALPAFPEEKLDVPLVAVRRWLGGQDAVPVSDVDAPGERPEPSAVARPVWRVDEDGVPHALGPSRAGETAGDVSRLRPGDLLYVPSAWGGLRRGTWDPTAADAVDDLADLAAQGAGWVAWRPREGDLATPDASPDTAADTRAQLVARANEESASARPASAADIVEYGSRWAVVKPLSRRLDGRDRTNSHPGVRVTLREHLDGVAAAARTMGERCGLPGHLVCDLELAGRLHDLGKADERFQLGLVADAIDLAMLSEPLAKSGNLWPGRRAAGDPLDAYPADARHEFLSVALAESAPEVLAGAHDRDLVLHLVLTHHGHGRCWPLATPDPRPRMVSVSWGEVRLAASSLVPATLGADARARFDRLSERYGVHGLAWLEAVFRLADHRRSESEALAGGLGT